MRFHLLACLFGLKIQAEQSLKEPVLLRTILVLWGEEDPKK